MSTTQNLKFIHLSTGSASDHKAKTGAIIFEKASGRIAVANGTDVEYYGGGRGSDAKFESNILTISFNDTAETIKLDFSDVASTSGVHAVLQPLANRVKTLEATVNGAEGVVGLVTKVATNTSDIAAINNPTSGILASAKSYTNDEIVKLRGGADKYTGTLKDLDGRIASNATNITNLQDLHANKTGESGKMKVIDEINAKVGWTEDTTVKTYVDDAVKTVTNDATALAGKVTTLEGTVKEHGTKITTLIGADANKSVRTIANEELAAQLIPAGAKESLDTLQEIAAWIQSHPDDASKMNGKITALETAVGKAAVGETPASGLFKAVDDNAKAIEANANAITSNDNDIAALQRLHAKENGSMKTVAAEVKAGIDGLGETSVTSDDKDGVVVTVTTTKGKVSDVAVNAKGIADKVGTLETSVGAAGDVANAGGSVYARIAKNAADIATNASTISANTGKIDGHTTRIVALEGKHAEGKTVAQEVSAGITGIAEVSKSNVAGSDVVVTVKTKSGSVSEVAVDASVLKKAVTDETTRAKGIENKLRADLGTKLETEGDAFTRIKALEKNQADGALMWSVWD